MTLQAQDYSQIPAQTVAVAQQAFPKGNIYLKLRDKLGVLYRDAQFAELFCATSGQACYSPGQLAMVTVMQFMESLSDRQAAEAVRSRIDWKYILGLSLTDTGFDYSVLSEFRQRLLTGEQSSHLLDELLRVCQAQGWLQGQGKQRTDSTHVLAAVRQMQRLEVVGETLRHSLEILATVAPDWLLAQVEASWLARYAVRVEQSKLAPSKAAQAAMVLTIGHDGHHLLRQIDESATMVWLSQIPAVQILRQVWIQQYYIASDQLRWRDSQALPPHRQLIQSPYDVETRNRTKRQTNWTGYTVHLSETCEDQGVNLITHVVTTPATTGDSPVLPEIHQALAQKQLAPQEHFVDMGYVHSAHLHSSQQAGIDLVAPIPAEKSWATQHPDRLAIPTFAIDWTQQTVTCPMQKTSFSWIPAVHSDGDDFIRVNFSQHDCGPCARRADCINHPTRSRRLHLLPKDQFLALQTARQRQATPEFKQRYQRRAGIEGTISQGVRAFELRRSRYRGLAKTHLQQVATATAMNLVRLAAYLDAIPKGQTRCSHFAQLLIPLLPA
jgi:transposase